MMKKIFLLLCSVGLVLGIVANSTAQPVTLQSLFDGGSISIYKDGQVDKVFSDWGLLAETSTNPAYDPDYSLVEVVEVGAGTLNPGLQFITNGQFAVADDDFLDVKFTFTVTTYQNPIEDNSLSLTGYSFGANNTGGLITIVEEVYDANGLFLADKVVEADNLLGTATLFDHAAFALQQSIVVEKNILVAGDAIGDLVSLDSFEQRFSQVPEPSTLLLLGGGLLGVVAVGRRARKG